MSRTLADLLIKLKLKHRIPETHPLLAIPLFLFKEEEYADLVTVLYLWSKGLIQTQKAPKPGMVLGEVSYNHVQQFYSSIRSEIVRALSTPKDSSNFERKEKIESPIIHESLQIVSKPNIWVNATQVMLAMDKNIYYKKLTLCQGYHDECDFFLKWTNSYPISLLEQAHLISLLRHKSAIREEEDHINHFALILNSTELLKDQLDLSLHQDTQSLIYYYLTQLNKQKDHSIKNNYAPEILNYFYKVLTALSRKYPVTLKMQLLSLGIKIPKNLEPDLILLLNKDLRTVPGLTEEQWPELLYYAAFFVFNLAKTEPSMLRFTYSANELPTRLNLHAQRNTRYLNIYEHSLKEEAFNASFATHMKAGLVSDGLDLHPRLLSFICLKNCPSLKNLFLNTWKEQGKNKAISNTIAFISSTNPFLLGRVFIDKSTKKIITINNHDCLLLLQLQTIANQRTSTLRTHELSLGRPAKITKEYVESKQSSHDIAHKAPPFFSSTLIKPEELMVLQDEHQSKFQTIKAQIQDPTLQDTLYIGSVIEVCVANY